VGQKEEEEELEGVYIFLIWAKTKYLVGQTPKLIHSRYAPG